MSRALRSYQVTAVQSVHEAWTIYRSALLVLATGAGKTYTAATILVDRKSVGRTLWVAHRRELIMQARDALESVGLRCDIEMADEWARTKDLFGTSQCVVASKDTLRGMRLARFEPSAFDTIVIDEAHHSTASSYRDIVGRFPNAKVLGLTATPDRADKVGLGNVFETTAFEYSLRAAITEGYLTPIVQKRVECADIDVSDVKTERGDLSATDLARVMNVDAVLHQIARPLVREAGARPTICFTASVDAAHALVDVMAGYTHARCAAIDGTTPKELRERHLGAFMRGEVQFLFNCAVLTEGFDAPPTSCIAMARPTKSRSLYAQCIGRGTRLAPGKTDCLVLDFVGNAGRHTLVNALDVLAGKPIPEDVRKDAEEAAAKGMPSEEALAKAEAEAIKREERKEAERLRKARAKADVAYRTQTIDPFGGQPATPERVSALNATRYRKGLCSYDQSKVMSRNGLDPDLSRVECGKAFDALKANGWRATPEMRARWGVRNQGREAAE